jgi:membrane-associated phospholipid phosphatase
MAALTAVLAVLMAFDRIYLNAHWLTDVLAAPFLAVFILVTSILVFQSLLRWYTPRQSRFLCDSKA